MTSRQDKPISKGSQRNTEISGTKHDQVHINNLRKLAGIITRPKHFDSIDENMYTVAKTRQSLLKPTRNNIRLFLAGKGA